MALCGMFAVDNSDVVQDTTVADGDTQNQEDLYDYRNAQQKASPTINDDLALIISGLVSKAQMPIGKFLSKYNIGYINQLPQNKYDEAVKSLNDYMDKKREKDNQQFDQTDYLRA
jgi:hypothetical protein